MERKRLAELKDLITEKLTDVKYRKIIVMVGILGIALIFISNFKKPPSLSAKNITTVQITTQEYARQLEDNIKSIVCAISGVDQVKVLVTLESSAQTIYATEQKKNQEATEDKSGIDSSKKRESNDTETKYIKIKDANGAEKALSVTELQPSVKGVVVVCKGGDNQEIQSKIKDAVKTALNITSKRVYVTT